MMQHRKHLLGNGHFDGMAMGAIQFNITPKSLAQSRARYGYRGSVFAGVERAYAA